MDLRRSLRAFATSAVHALMLLRNKFQESGDFRCRSASLLDGGSGLGEAQLGSKQKPVGFDQSVDLIITERSPRQPNGVDATRSRRLAIEQGKRRHILKDAGIAFDEAMLTDRTPGMHAHSTAEGGIRSHNDMPAEQGSASEQHMVADMAIVSHMDASHQEAIRANDRSARASATPVDRRVLADRVAIADDDSRSSAREAGVLRITTEHAAGIDCVFAADCHIAHDRDAIDEHGSAAQACMRSDHAERADGNTIVQLGFRIDGSERIDERGHRPGL